MFTSKKVGTLFLGLSLLGITACSHLKAVTAPTWVYTSPEGRLELKNVNAGSRFCLDRDEKTVCGTYSKGVEVFAAAMARFNRAQSDVPRPVETAAVEFKPETGASWIWSMDPDGSFKDEKGGKWALVEFRQLGLTHKE